MKRLYSQIEKDIKLERIERFGPFTVAEVSYEKTYQNGNGPRTKKYQGYGISRQSQDDRENDEVGKNIALSRAKGAVARKAAGKKVNLSFMG